MVLMVGCGEQGPPVIPVQGVVTLDGQPVAKASVLFMPADRQPQAAGGVTDESGKFQLTTVVGPTEYQGAWPGNYRVVVTKSTMSQAVADESGLSVDGMAGPLTVEWIIPEKYSRPDTSGLTANVTPEVGEVKFQLVK